MNAILNKKGVDLKGCTIYVTMFPCVECAKIIVHSGITNIVYMSDTKKPDEPKYKAAKRLLTELENQRLITIR